MTESQLLLSGAFGRDRALECLRSKYAVWIDRVAAPLLYRFCQGHEFFTTDEVWVAFEDYPSPGERRVMGAVMRKFALQGLIVKTGVSEKSVMPACHARDKAVWQSKIIKEAGR